MTTRVTIDAHAGWDVRVTFINPITGEKGGETIVKALTTMDTHVWDDRSVLIEEIKPEPVVAAVEPDPIDTPSTELEQA